MAHYTWKMHTHTHTHTHTLTHTHTHSHTLTLTHTHTHSHSHTHTHTHTLSFVSVPFSLYDWPGSNQGLYRGGRHVVCGTDSEMLFLVPNPGCSPYLPPGFLPFSNIIQCGGNESPTHHLPPSPPGNNTCILYRSLVIHWYMLRVEIWV